MARKIRFHSPYAPIPLAEILKKEMDRDWTAEEEKSGRVIGWNVYRFLEVINSRILKEKIYNKLALKSWIS